MICELTRGPEKYSLPSLAYLKKTEAVVFVYDVNEEDSLKEVEFWISFFFDVIPNKEMLYLVANKCDLSFETDHNCARQLARKYGMDLVVTSAKTGFNVGQLFDSIITKIAQSKFLQFTHLVFIISSLIFYIFIHDKIGN